MGGGGGSSPESGDREDGDRVSDQAENADPRPDENRNRRHRD